MSYDHWLLDKLGMHEAKIDKIRCRQDKQQISALRIYWILYDVFHIFSSNDIYQKENSKVNSNSLYYFEKPL